MRKFFLLALVVLASCSSGAADSPPETTFTEQDKRVLAEMRKDTFLPIKQMDDFEVVATVEALCKAIDQTGSKEGFLTQAEAGMRADEHDDVEQFISFQKALKLATTEYCPQFA